MRAIPHAPVKVLVERVKVPLKLFWAPIHSFRRLGWVLVHIWQQDGLRERWSNVLAGAAVAVTACADFVVERAVDTVLLRATERRAR